MFVILLQMFVEGLRILENFIPKLFPFVLNAYILVQYIKIWFVCLNFKNTHGYQQTLISTTTAL